MQTDINIDLFIFRDESKDLDKAKKYIDGQGLDDETRLYYQSVIQTKYVIETELNNIESQMFHQYFFGFSLKEMPRYYDAETGLDLPHNPYMWRCVLARACYKFALATGTNAQSPKLFNQFLSVNAYRHNIKKIIKSKRKQNQCFKDLYYKYKEYQDCLLRAAERLRLDVKTGDKKA